MKATWLSVLAILLCACGSGSDNTSSSTPAGPKVATKTVTLQALEEAPQVMSAAFGTGTLTIDLETGAISGDVATHGARNPRVFLDEGDIDAAGTQVSELESVPSGDPGPGAEFRWRVAPGTVLAPAQIESAKAGRLFLNARTPDNGPGEIRGQVGRRAYFARLRGAQESPAVETAGSGFARFELDPDARVLSGIATVDGTGPTSVELGVAAVGANGATAVRLEQAGSTWIVPAGTVLDPAIADALRAGMAYVNVRTAAHPDGEVRGQVYSPVRFGTLSGASAVPPVATNATGTCSMMVSPAQGEAIVRLATSIDSATAAHVHLGNSAFHVDLFRELDSASRPRPGVWKSSAFLVDDAMFAAFLRGELYCDVHTDAHPEGELRATLGATP